MRHSIPKRPKEQAVIAINANLRDYSQDPLIVRKTEKTRAFIAKNGLPKDKRKNARTKKA